MTDILESITEPLKLEAGAEDREPFRCCWLGTLVSDTCARCQDKVSRHPPFTQPHLLRWHGACSPRTVPVLLGAKQNEFRWAVCERYLFYRKSLLCEGTDVQVPNTTLYWIASAGTYMPRAEHLNGDSNKDRNLYLFLPKDCLCSNIKPLEQHRVSNSMLNHNDAGYQTRC